MKQAALMQHDVQAAQQKLAQTTVEAEAGGGAVKVTMSGNHEVKRLTIAPELVASNDAKLVEDVVLAALQKATTQVEEVTSSEMGQVTGGLSLPGLM